MTVSSLALAAASFAFLTAVAAAEPTKYPLTLENCGETLTFQKAPASTVTVGQAATEVLYSLGLGDKVTGTSVWFKEVLPEFREVNDQVERLADNDPSFESVVAKRPELVTVQFIWHVGPDGIVATRTQFHDVDIPTYVLPADCVAKDNTVGVDGTRSELFSTTTIHQGIRELAQIFDIQGKGAELVASLAERENAAVERAKALDLKGVSAVFWFSSAEMDIDPYVAGRKGAPAYMMDKLGIKNIIESDEEWPVVGWETIAKANPKLIVIAKMDRRRFPADDYERKLEFLKSDPVASQMDAVKNDRIVVMDAHAMDATIRTIAGIEVLSKSLKDFGLAQ
ncbi:ABC transporter substrate-binding protein [Mesorhizobium tianshanense]|uniref:Iron complex transport system substrate-binding protein n=1 Tax=Mesorhizobium tianshanense TaxID=39844 RepID=A0A562MW17_9HYPH|nr:ABC transporter substrate-binding protein [Mesorhizobium tianshanense]TWI24105.1 iron complex transport system substrate-binding protein [Mesorhizobium tianshanense]GLS41708.1 ABC transporter substrate-binding protein [Mesorhizobium tianshanense]